MLLVNKNKHADSGPAKEEERRNSERERERERKGERKTQTKSGERGWIKAK